MILKGFLVAEKDILRLDMNMRQRLRQMCPYSIQCSEQSAEYPTDTYKYMYNMGDSRMSDPLVLIIRNTHVFSLSYNLDTGAYLT